MYLNYTYCASVFCTQALSYKGKDIMSVTFFAFTCKLLDGTINFWRPLLSSTACCYGGWGAVDECTDV